MKVDSSSKLTIAAVIKGIIIYNVVLRIQLYRIQLINR